MNGTDDPFKELTEELKNLRERAKSDVPTQVNAETMIICDDEFLTADTELPSDSDILAEFRRDENELEEEDEVLIDEPSPKTSLKTRTVPRHGCAADIQFIYRG